MRLRLLAAGILGALGLATAGHAASGLDWSGSVGGGGSYFSLRSTDPTAPDVEDVQIRESLGNYLTFDNAYLHLGTRYTLTAVQFRRNPDLNYLDHNMQLDVNMDRWLSRHLADSRLQITLAGRLSPSLPALDPSRVSRVSTPPPTEPGSTVEPTPTERFVQDDLLNLHTHANGVTLYYGMAFSSELDPIRHYNLGWLVVDNRYDTPLVADATALSLRGAYAVRLSRGEAGVGASHDRLLRGAARNDVYRVSVFRSSRSRRLACRLEPGISYRRELRRYAGSFSANVETDLPRVRLRALYDTELRVITIGRTTVSRENRVQVTADTPRNYHFPRSLTLSGSDAPFVKRLELSLRQTVRFTRSLQAALSYAWSRIRWVQDVTGSHLQRTSNMVALNLRWTFL